MEYRKWKKALKAIYSYRSWWLDFPTLSLLALYFWHFFSYGVHPVPGPMPETIWAILGMYWLVKEGVRWALHEIQSRRGSILVSLWLVSLMIMFFFTQLDPNKYTIPPQMIETTLIILGGFLGLLPVKRMFAKKFPEIAKAFEPSQTE